MSHVQRPPETPGLDTLRGSRPVPGDEPVVAWGSVEPLSEPLMASGELRASSTDLPTASAYCLWEAAGKGWVARKHQCSEERPCGGPPAGRGEYQGQIKRVPAGPGRR